MPKVYTFWGETRYVRRVPAHVLKVRKDKTRPTITLCKIPYTAANPTEAQMEQRKTFAEAAINAYREDEAKVAGGPGYYEEFISEIAAACTKKESEKVGLENIKAKRKAKHEASLIKWGKKKK